MTPAEELEAKAKAQTYETEQQWILVAQRAASEGNEALRRRAKAHAKLLKVVRQA